MLRGTSGYAVLIDPLKGTKEADTFTCAHMGSEGCVGIVHVKPGAPLEEIGGRCGFCDKLICRVCMGKRVCVPQEQWAEEYEREHNSPEYIERQLKLREAQLAAWRSYDECSR